MHEPHANWFISDVTSVFNIQGFHLPMYCHPLESYHIQWTVTIAINKQKT